MLGELRVPPSVPASRCKDGKKGVKARHGLPEANQAEQSAAGVVYTR